MGNLSLTEALSKIEFKFFRVYAHYNRNVSPEEYVVIGVKSTTIKQVKEWFYKNYPWLDVHRVEEIAKEDACNTRHKRRAQKDAGQ